MPPNNNPNQPVQEQNPGQPYVGGQQPQQTPMPAGNATLSNMAYQGGGSSDGSKTKLLAVVGGSAILIVIILVVVVLLLGNKPNKPTNTPTQKSSGISAIDENSATPIKLQQNSDAISHVMSSMDYNKDFPPYQLLDDSLGL